MKYPTRIRRFARHRRLVFVSIFYPSLTFGALPRCSVLCLVGSLLFLVGCGARLSSPEQVTKFKKAGPIQAVIDFDQLAKGRPGPYRVIPGDILEFQMHVDLRIVSAELADWLRPTYGHKEIEPYLVRVSDAGTITLPIIGEIQVAGKTLAEIEQAVKNAYYPKYVVNPPMLVCQVKEYQAEHERVFTVMGLVNKPDAYAYPPDVQYNLMEALAFAGGLDMVAVCSQYGICIYAQKTHIRV